MRPLQPALAPSPPSPGARKISSGCPTAHCSPGHAFSIPTGQANPAGRDGSTDPNGQPLVGNLLPNEARPDRGTKLLTIDGDPVAEFPRLELLPHYKQQGHAHPTFSPQGDQLALIRTEGDACAGTLRQFLPIAAPDGSQHTLDEARYFIRLAWSPSGDQIAYTTLDSQILVVDFDDGPSRLLIDGQNTLLGWHPSGDRILYWPQISGGGLCS